MRGKQFLFIALALLVLAVVVYFYFKGRRVKSADISGSFTTTPTPETPTPTKPQRPDYPFYNGLKLPIIKDIQHALNLKFKSGLAEDSTWGPKTATAVTKNTGRINAYSYADAVKIYKSILLK